MRHQNLKRIDRLIKHIPNLWILEEWRKVIWKKEIDKERGEGDGSLKKSLEAKKQLEVYLSRQ